MIPLALLIIVAIAVEVILHFSHHLRLTRVEQDKEDVVSDVMREVAKFLDPVRGDVTRRLADQDDVIADLKAQLARRRGKATDTELAERIAALEQRFR